jgi:hypothetical protein
MNTEALSRTLCCLERESNHYGRCTNEYKMMKGQMAVIANMIITITKRRMKLRGFEE